MFEKINSHNEWDKLKEIIVGSADGSRASITWVNQVKSLKRSWQ